MDGPSTDSLVDYECNDHIVTIAMNRPDKLTREAHFQAQPMQLYRTEDFDESALAFKEKRKPRAFKGR